MTGSVSEKKIESKKVIGIVFIALGAVILILSLINTISAAVRASEADYLASKNTTVQGTASNVWTERVRKRSSTGRSYRYSNHYHAQVIYTYNDKEYIKSDVDLGTKKVETGNTITLYIDPDDPSHALYDVNSAKKHVNIITGVLGLVVGLVFAVIGIFAMKNRVNVDLKDFIRSDAEKNYFRAHPDPSVKDLDKHYEHYGEFSKAEMSMFIDRAQRTGNMNSIDSRTPTDEELMRAQQNSYNDISEERRKRAEMERYQDSRGFGSNYIDNPRANYEKGSDAWDDDLPPIYDEPPEYQASKYARPSPVAGKYDPNVSYRAPDMDNLDPISPFTSDGSADDDGWGFLGK